MDKQVLIKKRKIRNSFHVLAVIILATTVCCLLLTINKHLSDANSSLCLAYQIAYDSTSRIMQNIADNPTSEDLKQLWDALVIEEELFEAIVQSHFIFMNNETKNLYLSLRAVPHVFSYSSSVINLDPLLQGAQGLYFDVENYDSDKRDMLEKIVDIREKTFSKGDIWNLNKVRSIIRSFNVININAFVEHRASYFKEVLDKFPQLHRND